ncbi:hypothetical protein INT43_005753 [Umbelopsis isabellina]|uniref:Zn(2)-C6 fungal-type domain-containing protein n=1 Tax=Mortierella isabellina TaxID=91625 RepID=A0A8H7U9I6_MORIS|nr:hypothetical protein INT43_005753 [Umbelopsis isabellina]
MKTSRYSTSRQKACQHCANAKAKCERNPANERCARCKQRGLLCAYPNANATERSKQITVGQGDARLPSPISLPDLPFNSLESELLAVAANNNANTTIPRTIPPMGQEKLLATYVADSPDNINFSNLDLVCPINADDIKNRWIQAYISAPEQITKDYSKSISAYIYRVLKSYTAVAINGHGILPFVHSQQMMSQPRDSPLTTCLSLARICSSPLPNNNDAAANIIQREMHSLYELRDSYNEETLSAAFQAYLIYAMILFFRLRLPCNAQFRDIMTSLQDLASASARQGLICAADQRRIRPRWEEWIVAEAKRRTLFVMYLFDSILSAQMGFPTFLGTELHGLPAPANKLLWQAATRYEWEREYNIHMSEWMEGFVTIDEFWPTPVDMGEISISRRRARVDHWLENLDEYGTMLYAVMKCTHGE